MASKKSALQKIKTIGVIGAGQMGKGIAQVAAQTGYKVLVIEPYEEILVNAQEGIEKSLDRNVERGKIKKKDKDNIISRIGFAKNIEGLAEADYVIEAAVENEAVKMDIFSSLDRICDPQTILTTNTSSVRLGKLAGITKRPEKVLGMHFMYPAQKMKLLEIIKTPATSDNYQ